MKTISTFLLALILVGALSYLVIHYANTQQTSDAMDNVYRPADAHEVVLTWPSKHMNEQDIKSQIAAYLATATHPGNSAHYVKASLLIDSAKRDRASVAQDAELLYYDAIVKQHFHNFDAALNTLDRLIENDQDYANAYLLKANMLMVLGRFEEAKNVCRSLIAKVDNAIVAACSLDIDAQNSKNSDLSKRTTLLNMETFFPPSFFALSDRDAQNKQVLSSKVWIAQIKASLQKNSGQFQQAQSTLQTFLRTPDLSNELPVSFWVLWAEVSRSLGENTNVINVLSKLVNRNTNKDDALLLQLALAERALDANNTNWQDLLSVRIQLREARNDQEHAFDIATYYLEINHKPELALKWAQINWTQAKLLEDYSLLERAEANMFRTNASWSNYHD